MLGAFACKVELPHLESAYQIDQTFSYPYHPSAVAYYLVVELDVHLEVVGLASFESFDQNQMDLTCYKEADRTCGESASYWSYHYRTSACLTETDNLHYSSKEDHYRMERAINPFDYSNNRLIDYASQEDKKATSASSISRFHHLSYQMTLAPPSFTIVQSKPQQ